MHHTDNAAAGKQHRPFLYSKYMLSLALAIVLLPFVAAARQFSAQVMTTYTSTDGGFRFTYPSTWTLHINEVSVAGTDVFHPVENVLELDAPGKPRPYILIEYMYNVDGQNLNDFIENSSECDEITGQPGQSVLVDGMPARVFRNINCNTNGETRIYIVNGLTGYNILLHGKPVDETVLSMVLANFVRIRKIS